MNVLPLLPLLSLCEGGALSEAFFINHFLDQGSNYIVALVTNLPSVLQGHPSYSLQIEGNCTKKYSLSPIKE